MQIQPLRYIVFLFAVFGGGLNAQLITTDPAAPTDDQAVTITFDATQGTGGLADCDCDVYLHTGVITNNSSNGADWQYVQTQWGVANAEWRLTPVSGQPNKYTFTYSPSIRAYFGVPAAEEIQQIAFVFRNADGSLEGKAAGNADIYVDVSAGGGALGLTFVGDPGTATFPLGKPLPILVGTTREATIEVYDNETLLFAQTGVELEQDIVLTSPGTHTIRVVAKAGDEEVTDEFTVDAILTAEFTTPTSNVTNAQPGTAVTLAGTSFISSALSVSDGTTEIFSGDAADFSVTTTLPDAAITTYTLTSTLGEETATAFVTYITGGPEVEAAPAGVRPGAVNMPNGDVVLTLRAPGKSDVFVLSNQNNFTPTARGRMKNSTDGETFHLTLPASALDGDLIYEYLIDGEIRQPDPYATLILDPNSDRFIGEETFSGIPPYPTGLASGGLLAWHRRSVAPYDWQSAEDYGRPDPEKMVIYELLVRDFLEDHSFKSLTDSLDYLQRLGVNAIELMPVSEFENNISWGYNVSFHMALDKYYGSPEDFKAFVDACHARGMAVILDAVYNHAFGQSPLVRIWADENNVPTADNPYANREARHPFNVGFDLNHESELTKQYFKETTKYWLEEFRVDGFRFDLSKGFTQNDTGNDVGAWNRYDASRVAILKDYADFIWSVDDEAYMIMEHLAEQREEAELAAYGNGMYFWSGFQPHDSYLQASMGYDNDNFRQVIARNRGFAGNNLIGYMESHDEERMQYKNEQFGNRTGDYDIRDENTGLERVKLASTFFYTVPGPKMLWQFGELGYDFNINRCPNGSTQEGCRTDPKPIRWDYRADFDRASVYNHIADLMYLRNNFDIFHGEIVTADFSGQVKRLTVRGDDGTAVIVGNFGVTETAAPNALPDGTWFNYFSDESLTVTGNRDLTLAPGEFRLYLDRDLESMAGGLPVSLNRAELARLDFSVNPNPTAGALNLTFTLARSTDVTIDLLDATGRMVTNFYQGRLARGAHQLDFRADGLAAGLYFLRVNDGQGTGVRTVVIR